MSYVIVFCYWIVAHDMSECVDLCAKDKKIEFKKFCCIIKETERSLEKTREANNWNLKGADAILRLTLSMLKV